MNEDDATIRTGLSAAWQKAVLDLVKSGVPPKTVVETLLAVGLAGHIGVRGKRATASLLLALAETIDREAGEEASAIKQAAAEAAHATKN